MGLVSGSCRSDSPFASHVSPGPFHTAGITGPLHTMNMEGRDDFTEDSECHSNNSQEQDSISGT